MINPWTRRSTFLFVSALLSGCSQISPVPAHQQGFFERSDPGGARCYGGAAIARGGEERVSRDSTWSRTVYMVIDTIQWQDGRQPAHIIGSTRSTDRIGATWAKVGDSLFVQEWGVLPETDYLLHENGNELTGRAWMEHDTVSCFNGVCTGLPTSHWTIHARRIPCDRVPRQNERS